MNETEVLIAEVERYPILWDVNDENYCNKTQRDRTWIEICMKLQTNWSDLSREDKLETCDSKKRQWNNVRDGYRKYLNRMKSVSADSAAKMKKYIYADNLHFLTEVLLNSKPREGNYCKRTGDLLDETEGRVKVPEIVNKDDEDEKNQQKLQEKEERTRIRKKKAKTRNDIQRQILSLVKRSSNNEINLHDEDTLFLLSFRSDMKLMSRSEKLQFKIDMVQLIQSVAENRRNGSPSSSSQSYTYLPEVVYATSPSPTHEESIT